MPAETVQPETAGPTRRQRLGNWYRANTERFKPKQFRAPSLDVLNFLIADVRGAGTMAHFTAHAELVRNNRIFFT